MAIAHARSPDDVRARDATALRVAGQSVLDAIRAGDGAAVEARFTDTLRAALTHERFEAALAQVRAEAGALRACDAPTILTRGLAIVEYLCDFERAPMRLRLTFVEGMSLELAGILFMPAPTPVPLPAGVRVESVTTGASGWPLPGMLLVPSGAARPPVVVLVHGSGPNDRDETVGANRPFLDLANGLAGRGIASLRYDKRTRAFAARYAAEIRAPTLDDEVVDDAVAAIALLAGRDDLGPVFVVGHSLGAWLAPRVAVAAARAKASTAGVVMIAAPATGLGPVLVAQYEYLSRLPGARVHEADIVAMRARVANVDRLVAANAAGGGGDGIGPLPNGAPASYWLDVGRYDPVVALANARGLPALLVFGGRDYQVPIGHEALWRTGLGERPDTTIVVFDDLDHLMIEGVSPSMPADYARPGHVAQRVVDRIADWIGAHAAARSSMEVDSTMQPYADAHADDVAAVPDAAGFAAKNHDH